jgi:two-component system, OmpR family, alkaline phosphatase synthesis response regulator PhoP
LGNGKILVVEDDANMSKSLRQVLENEGFQVKDNSKGLDALTTARSFLPDIILLDHLLPDITGFDVCRRLKAEDLTSRIPIIMVTGNHGETDAVMALELGADDYITKPFSGKVLVARVRAILRRFQNIPDNSMDVVQFHNIKMDRKKYRVDVEDLEIKLTTTEFKLLLFLASKPGWVFTRGQIVNELNGSSHAITDRSVDVQIVGLRKKLGPSGQYIETLRGVGYRIKDIDSSEDVK